MEYFEFVDVCSHIAGLVMDLCNYLLMAVLVLWLVITQSIMADYIPEYIRNIYFHNPVYQLVPVSPVNHDSKDDSWEILNTRY